MKPILTLYLLRQRINSTLVVLSLSSVLLLLLRVKITLSFYMLFLIWNLFLALLPYAISAFIKKKKMPLRSYRSFAVYALWLLFLPNSFYLLTDFIHLHHQNWLQFLFDFIMLLSFTMAGFYSGILSVYAIHGIIRKQFSVRTTALLIGAICILSAFGIYLGRMQRFNSWDILSDPAGLFTSILENFHKPSAVCITAALSVVIYLSYQAFLFTRNTAKPLAK